MPRNAGGRSNMRIIKYILAGIGGTALAMLIGMNVALESKPAWDVSYQMANAKISWLQIRMWIRKKSWKLR